MRAVVLTPRAANRLIEVCSVRCPSWHAQALEFRLAEAQTHAGIAVGPTRAEIHLEGQVCLGKQRSSDYLTTPPQHDNELQASPPHHLAVGPSMSSLAGLLNPWELHCQPLQRYADRGGGGAESYRIILANKILSQR